MQRPTWTLLDEIRFCVSISGSGWEAWKRVFSDFTFGVYLMIRTRLLLSFIITGPVLGSEAVLPRSVEGSGKQEV